MFDLADLVTLSATSADRRVLDALAYAKTHCGHLRDFIPDRDEHGAPIDVSFASGNWQKVLRDKGRPGQLVRQHFEACVFAYLAEELRTGDVAIAGAEEYADWGFPLPPWSQCQAKLPEYLVQVGLAADEQAAASLARHCSAAALKTCSPGRDLLHRAAAVFV